MITTRFAMIYSCLYTFVAMTSGVFWLRGYIFIPSIPFFYILLGCVCLIQGICFRRYSAQKTMQGLFAINLFINILFLYRIETLVFTQYFQLLHCIVMVLSINKYWGDWKQRVLFIASPLAYIVGIVKLAKQLAIPLGKTVVVSMLSIVLSLCSVFTMHPKIQQEGNCIAFGYPRESEFNFADSMMIEKEIDLGIGYFVRLAPEAGTVG